MANRLEAAAVIDLLKLEPLTGEGGYYRQTWALGDADRPESTAILYLVTPESFSSLHRLAFDELFHFYGGDRCQMIQVTPNGDHSSWTLGSNLAAGELPQVLVPAGCWQGTRLHPGGAWALLGTTMTPGFRPDIFEVPTDQDLNALSASARMAVDPFLPG